MTKVLLLILVVLTLGCTGSQEPASPPIQASENCMGFVIGAPMEATTIPLAGGAWARPHPGPFAWQWIENEKGVFFFDFADRWVHMAQDSNVAILGTIWPYADWDQETCREDSCVVTGRDQFCADNRFDYIGGKLPNWRCAPCDTDDYKNFVRTVVERYDGDGVDDMPGLLLPIKHWEISNEPEMQGEDLTFFIGRPEEYVEILKGGYEAVKEACPDCTVVQGGAAGSEDTQAFWGEVFDLGGGDYFDIANIHFINYGDAVTLNVKGFKVLMDEKGVDKPIWVTEAEFPSNDDVLASTQGALDAGASKIFFTRFEIGRWGPPEPGKYSEVYEKVPSMCKI
ncbi:hypothetical protein KKA03_05555 [archaeon]|nr:hypothetical protein [archaeon]